MLKQNVFIVVFFTNYMKVEYVGKSKIFTHYLLAFSDNWMVYIFISANLYIKIISL